MNYFLLLLFQISYLIAHKTGNALAPKYMQEMCADVANHTTTVILFFIFIFPNFDSNFKILQEFSGKSSSFTNLLFR